MVVTVAMGGSSQALADSQTTVVVGDNGQMARNVTGSRAKNAVFQNLFASLGFTAVPGNTDGASRWRLDLDAYQPRTTHIKRTAE